MMTPYRSLAKYCMTLVDVGQDKEKLLNFLRMEKWLSDRPDHTAASARQWLKELYQANKMYTGELEVGGRRVDLKNITMPVLNLYTETDTVIPPPAECCARREDRRQGLHAGCRPRRPHRRIREPRWPQDFARRSWAGWKPDRVFVFAKMLKPFLEPSMGRLVIARSEATRQSTPPPQRLSATSSITRWMASLRSQ